MGLGENVVEEVLREEGDHGVGGHPAVVGGEPHPQSQHSLVGDALPEAVEDPPVEQFPLLIYIVGCLPGFIFMILVLTLSKGSEITDTATPEMADEISRTASVSSSWPTAFIRASFDSL